MDDFGVQLASRLTRNELAPGGHDLPLRPTRSRL